MTAVVMLGLFWSCLKHVSTSASIPLVQRAIQDVAVRAGRKQQQETYVSH